VRDLALQLVTDKVFTTIHYSTVHLIPEGADLKPRRTLYWKRSQDPDFDKRGVHVLWCYQMAECLKSRRELVLCVDEKTQIQMLGRKEPDIPMLPGCPARREHEYVRLGTGILLPVNDIVTGELFGKSLDYNRARSSRRSWTSTSPPAAGRRRSTTSWTTARRTTRSIRASGASRKAGACSFTSRPRTRPG